MKKIAIIGSRNLAGEITQWISEQKDVQIVAGMHPPFKGWWQDEFKDVLEKHSIPTFSVLDELIRVTKPDIIFSINYWQKIPADLINIVSGGIINIHHSYKLKFKGRYSTSWAIMHARKDNCWEHGTTLHFIDENLDEGKIIDSWKCNIEEMETAETLFAKVEVLALEMFKANFEKMLNGVTEFSEPSDVTYFYDINSNRNLEVNNLMPIEDIYDFVRAWSFKDRPKPFFLFNGQKIYLSLKDN